MHERFLRENRRSPSRVGGAIDAMPAGCGGMVVIGM
ncbi:tryptophanyl-tRNA synthetase [Burkholderia pseudomallei]|nr:hypothetical protein BPC006_II2489 [Burkholderia pseudomallei BPC006]ANW53132.1 tryptophanyl-tRNA synthetase [Burkholderia pseudomallei]AOP68498.1 tryptophanyl-tRNA synthetase [Burkholderia mallei]ANW59106.1 tryptophanyl-tRNA synthetase [Burkholderia pseudomallei]APD39271.1 tryptophanyl-tRNA synthetase [Burkholderia pseudomallei]